MPDEQGGELIQIVVGGEWFTLPEPSIDCALIMFSHPEHGKLWFGLPFDQAAHLAGYLTRQVADRLAAMQVRLDERQVGELSNE